jgi:hypothetical protein
LKGKHRKPTSFAPSPKISIRQDKNEDKTKEGETRQENRREEKNEDKTRQDKSKNKVRSGSSYFEKHS